MPGRKRGFTLVELSIVLVIIGLLIGGILVGQSMMETARITSFVKQIQQFDIASADFKTKYGYLSSDAPMNGGDGDGMIRCCGGGNDHYFQGEIEFFFYYLSLYENIKPGGGVYNPWSTGFWAIPNISVPSVGIGNNTVVNVYTPQSIRAFFPNVTIYGVAGVDPTGNNGGPPSISAPDALAVDTKLDDGSANSGNVRAMGGGVGSGPTNTAGTGCVMNTDATKYNTASTTAYPCGLGIVVMSSNGGTQ